MTLRTMMFFVLTTFLSFQISGQSDDYSESPYFQLEGKKSEFGFPLLANKMEATILGPIADVTIKQTYKNTGKKVIEATYIFPSSTRAAVYHLEMIIGDRTIVAEVQKKEDARKTYEKAKSEGKRTSLLEQHRPNVFQMNVANIMPGEEISVIMKYTEYIIPEDQEYTFVYPGVVGPRFSGEQPEVWAGQAFSTKGSGKGFDYDISVNMNASIPITKMECSSHQMTMSQTQANDISMKLDKYSGFGGDRDFILKYRLSGDKIETGVKTFEKNGEHFFLCQMEAPVLSSEMNIVPREYIFIVDVSGSMTGFPLTVSKNLMKSLFTKLKPSDKFNVLFFAGSAFMLNAQSLDATDENIQFAMKEVNATQQRGGGTRMLNAIQKAMSIPKDEDYSRSFVIVTDGLVTVEEKAFKYIANNLNDSNFYAFGIGNSINRFLIDGLAHVGQGAPFIVTEKSEAEAQAEKLRKYIQYPVLSNIEVKGVGLKLYDIIPERVPDLMAGRPIYFFGKYKANGNSRIKITGNQGGKKFLNHIILDKPEEQNSAISYLWAREKIRFLDDFNTLRHDNEKVEEITNLGLNYNLLTDYTSFVAVDDEVVNKDGDPDLTKQILSIPKGMSHLAIGFEMEVEEIVEGEETMRFDIEVASDDDKLNQVADILLESIMETVSNLPSISTQSIEVKYNVKGELTLDPKHDFYAIIARLGKALHDFGYDLKNLNFIVNIEKKN